MKNILITDYIESPFPVERDALGAGYQLYAWADIENDTQARESIDAMLIWHRSIDGAFLDKLPNCKIGVRYGVGTENVDFEAFKSRERIFCNTPDYGTEEVADSAVGMILSLTRKIAAYDYRARYLMQGWKDPISLDVMRSNTRSVGIVGAGRIGTATIQRLKPFGFEICAYDPHLPSGHEKAIGYRRFDDLQDMVQHCDIISIHASQNEGTIGMVNKDFIDWMKPGSYLINTARGAIVESMDVIEYALDKLGGVALDVQPKEPVEFDHPLIQKWKAHDTAICEKLILNPHSAYFSKQAWYEMRFKAAETARLYLEKNTIRNRMC